MDFESPEEIFQLSYASAAPRPFLRAELRELLGKARENNARIGITGLLLYHEQSFLQVIEGPEETVRSLYARISRDPRHDRVLLLMQRHHSGRSFAQWRMGFVDKEENQMLHGGFLDLLGVKASFLGLQNDSKMVAKLIDGFQEGRWRQAIG
ncbi:MAG: BLUF domain-containing protein [Chthoniobacteraceae bacterium]